MANKKSFKKFMSKALAWNIVIFFAIHVFALCLGLIGSFIQWDWSYLTQVVNAIFYDYDFSVLRTASILFLIIDLTIWYAFKEEIFD